MSRYSRFAKPKTGNVNRYKCTKCGSTDRLFVQCQPCLLRFIEATDVKSKSSYYKPEHLYHQRSY